MDDVERLIRLRRLLADLSPADLERAEAALSTMFPANNRRYEAPLR